MQNLGTIYSMLGRIAEAEELLRANLKLRLQAGGDSDEKTVEAKENLLSCSAWRLASGILPKSCGARSSTCGDARSNPTTRAWAKP